MRPAEAGFAAGATGTSALKDVSVDGGQFTRMFNPVYTLGYNTQLVKEADAPKSWADAASGKWQGKVGIVHGRSGGSTAALNRFMEAKLGGGTAVNVLHNEMILTAEVPGLGEMRFAGMPVKLSDTPGMCAFPLPWLANTTTTSWRN